MYITYIKFTYTECSLKKVGAMVGSMEETSRRTKKSYTILPILQ